MDSFWDKVDVRAEEFCWHWRGATLSKGYGVFRVPGTRKNIGAHRMSWILRFGDVPEGVFVCHRCDTPSCVNPCHLFLGTVADNNADMRSKGRAGPVPCRRGERHPRAKVNECDVARMRSLFALGASGPSLARLYGLSNKTVYAILKREGWKHVP